MTDCTLEGQIKEAEEQVKKAQDRVNQLKAEQEKYPVKQFRKLLYKYGSSNCSSISLRVNTSGNLVIDLPKELDFSTYEALAEYQKANPHLRIWNIYSSTMNH